MQEKNGNKGNEKAAKAIDGFISAYYEKELAKDFSRLTPYQRISVFLRCISLRLPKFKAIDLHTATDITMSEVQECVGRLLGPLLEGVTSRR